MNFSQAHLIGATQLNVGTSAGFALEVSAPAYVNGWKLKYVSGGTLEIVNSGASIAFGTGYLVGTTELLEFNGPAKFYLKSTGATSVVHALMFKSAGATNS